jgi:hypothetical protein
MEKISDKKCLKYQKKLLDLNETLRVYYPNKKKRVIFGTQFYDPRISQIHHIMCKISRLIRDYIRKIMITLSDYHFFSELIPRNW